VHYFYCIGPNPYGGIVHIKFLLGAWTGAVVLSVVVVVVIVVVVVVVEVAVRVYLVDFVAQGVRDRYKGS
jgi:hypothetical protein